MVRLKIAYWEFDFEAMCPTLDHDLLSQAHIYIYDLVPKGVHENRTKVVENKVDDTLKLVVFLECAQC